MKTWNLSSFEDVVPTVLASVDKQSSAEFTSARRRRRVIRSMTVSAVGTVVVAAAVSLTAIRMDVSGSNEQLRISSMESVSNVQSDRPPLELMFSQQHPLKWSREAEQEMLKKAAAAVSRRDKDRTSGNTIHSLLKEELPPDRDDTVDLSSLRIKLG